MKKSFVVLLFMTLLLFLISMTISVGRIFEIQERSISNNSFIEWKNDYKLSWNDFQGKVDSLSEYKAKTFCKLSVKDSITISEILVDVTCKFNKKTSWSKNKKSITLLEHEQLHFDIAELMVRKIRKEYSVLASKDLDSTHVKMTSVYNKYVDSIWVKTNEKYDTETDHGTIEKKQKEWELKIAKELKALEKYAATRVVIKRVKK